MEFWIPAAIIFLGGLVKGLNGFGYALISTSLLTTIMPAQRAIALMIIPLIAGNLELASGLNRKELENCMNAFSGFLIFLGIGVTVGMLTISIIPSRPLKTSVGITSLVFAGSQTNFLQKYFRSAKNFCLRTWTPLIGFFSGIVYGASNIAVLVVAYLEVKNLSREKFVGVLSVVILIFSIYRILLAQITGIYAGTENILLSLLLAVPSFIAVKTGDRISEKVSGEILQRLSVGLIAVIGLKLILPF